MYTESLLPLWLIVVPAVGGLLEFLLGRRGRHPLTGLPAVVASLITLALGGAGIAQVAAGHLPTAASLHLMMDSLGSAVVFLGGVLGTIGLAYARQHLQREVAAGRAKAEWLPGLFGCSALFIAAGNWAALTDYLIVLYIAVEATTIATVLPVAFYRSRPSWQAAYKYILVNAVGLTAGLLGLGVLYGAAAPLLGDRALELSALSSIGSALPAGAAALAGGLLICGFGTKAGLVPFHTWLPDAYQESPGGFSALFAGVGTKVPLLAIARVLPPLVAATPALGTALMALAAISMLFGIVSAFRQDDLRRLLGYSSVSQMGYIAMALAAGGATGYAAASYHMVSHGLLKALLFLAVAEVFQATGTASIAELTKRPAPKAAGIIFLLASLGLGGVPPMPAFWSKFQVFEVAAGSGQTWAVVIAVLTSLLTITTMVWAGARAFLLKEHGAEQGEERVVARPDAWLLSLLTVVIFAVGLAPGWVTAFLNHAAQLITAMGG